jgi:uncharacterized 2Fe-2S/4Fe-4S cluster protein (DUF4445 family)
VFPFTPVTIDFVEKKIDEVFKLDVNINPQCKVISLPGISTYVGSDIVAGIFFSEMYKKIAPSILIDIGTNGEMVLASGGKLLAAATAAGPAFEGGNMKCGTGSVPGAICSVKYIDKKFECKTIADEMPAGICGTGIIELVWEILSNNLIDSGGRFDNAITDKKIILAHREDGEEIFFSQRDLRELQLAKSAICSGVQALLHGASLKPEQIETLYIAGGFGNKLNFTSGAGIGIIPKALEKKVVVIGNSSLGGAVKFLFDKNARSEMEIIIKQSSEYNLGGDPFFNEAFIDNIEFD